MAVINLAHQSTRHGRSTFAATSPGAVAVGDTFKLSIPTIPYGTVKILSLRVAASGGSVTRVDPAAYLDAARTATGQTWAGSWTSDDDAGPVFAASGGDARITLDEDGAAWIDPGLDDAAGAVTVQIALGVS